MIRTANFDPTRTYRYTLGRQWGIGGRAVFVMLNPSTADEHQEDPTIRRCIGYARDWGFGSLTILNIFALRSTDPRALLTSLDPVGPGNDAAIVSLVRGSDMVVAAWGAHGRLKNRGECVRDMLSREGFALHYLKLTNDGQPGHPLYLKSSLLPKLWTTRTGGRPSWQS